MDAPVRPFPIGFRSDKASKLRFTTGGSPQPDGQECPSYKSLTDKASNGIGHFSHQQVQILSHEPTNPRIQETKRAAKNNFLDTPTRSVNKGEVYRHPRSHFGSVQSRQHFPLASIPATSRFSALLNRQMNLDV